MAKYSREESISDINESANLLAYVAEVREWDNRFHLKRIKAYVYLLCTKIGIPKAEVDQIAVASQLHDIGKCNTPLDLLLRKGEYSADEWKIMEEHTLNGETLLRKSNNPIYQIGAIISATHHERWDGSGYPRKLYGENIPLSGRICAIADVYDALTTSRPYKTVMPEAEVLVLIRESSGTFFDPDVVNAFLENYPAIRIIKENSSF
jgi:putative two-component system response regulator